MKWTNAISNENTRKQKSMVKWKYLQKQWWKTLKGSPKKKRNFLSLGLKRFISWNMRDLWRVGFLIFWALKVTSWNIRTAFFWENIKHFFGVTVSWSIRNFPGVDIFYFSSLGWEVQGSISGNVRKAFFWENIRFF